MLVRVVAQHTAKLYAMLGLHEVETCVPHLIIDEQLYNRVESTNRWVLYRLSTLGDE